MTFKTSGTTQCFRNGWYYMFKHEKVIWITRTAVLIALTIALQALTMQFGNQIITGSIVNLMLIIAVMTCSLSTGLTVAAVTPILPTLLGFGPLWPIVPFIAVGNMALVTVWHFLGNRELGSVYISYGLAMAAGAVVKFLVLYLGVVQLAIPYILGLPSGNVLSIMFSYPQLITAATGGVCAAILLPSLLKAIKQRRA